MDDSDHPPEIGPDLYREAASILTKAVGKKATLKTLIYSSQYKNIRKLFALVNECMKYKDIIEEVASHCSSAFMEEEIVGNNLQMAVVLLYEYLLGRKFGRDVLLRKMFQRYKNDVKAAVDKVLTSHEARTLQEAAKNINRGTATQIPRYMRVNLIKSSVQSVVEDLKLEGWDYVGMIDKDAFSETVLSFNEAQFGLDPMLSDLLVFPIGTDLHDHYLTKTGVLVQQDRASCVPAHVLNPARGSVVLDCCSAPGNKTSHLASLLKDKGRVIALDRDYKRMLTMSQLLKKSGATCVELIHQDFLTVQPGSEDASYINFILVDPSCSGSGMLGSQMDGSNQRQDDQRLQTLKRFQISILKHALRFPNVERVVYSTCSIHQEENEQVAEEVMAQVSEYFQFHPVFPEWKNSRGISSFPHAEFFLRLTPQHDLTQGFFVACFERVKHKQQKLSDGEKNENRQNDNSNSTVADTERFENDSLKSSSKAKRKAKRQQEVTEGQVIPTAAGKKKSKKKKKKQKRSSETNISSQIKNTKESVDNEDASMKFQQSQNVKQKSVDSDVASSRSGTVSDDNIVATSRVNDAVLAADKAGKAGASESKKRKHRQRTLSHDDSCTPSPTKAKKRKKAKNSSLGKNGICSPGDGEISRSSSFPMKKHKKKGNSSDTPIDGESAYADDSSVHHSDMHSTSLGKVSLKKKKRKKSKIDCDQS